MENVITTATADVSKLSVETFAATYKTFAQAAAIVSAASGKKIRYQQIYQKYQQGKIAVVEIGHAKYIHIDTIAAIVAKRVAYFEK